jgi:hypothetical protein
MVEIKKCIQVINFEGNIVYRFRDIAELLKYNDSYWKFAHNNFVFQLNATNYCTVDKLLFYVEDQKIESNINLIYAILDDASLSDKIDYKDIVSINRYGSQYTADVLKQVLDVKEPKTIHTQVDWESQVFGNYNWSTSSNNSGDYLPTKSSSIWAYNLDKFKSNPINAVLPVNQGVPLRSYHSEPSMLDKLKEQTLKLRMEKEKRQDALGGQDGGNYDDKGNSDHYQKQFMEFVRAQERLYGTIVAHLVCIANVDKYNQRAGVKEGVPASKDLTKRDWYQKAARHFKLKIEAHQNGFIATNRNAYVPMAEEVKDLICLEHPFSELFNVGYVPLSEAIEK